MRVLQALGSSSVGTVGAGTLADMYDPHVGVPPTIVLVLFATVTDYTYSQERGQMMGIYYASPLLGPAIGPSTFLHNLSASDRQETLTECECSHRRCPHGRV